MGIWATIFLSTPSARRATRVRFRRPQKHKVFLSTPSARRATLCKNQKGSTARYFYPRPPRGGRPTLFSIRNLGRTISIHALREEGDLKCDDGHEYHMKFLSTPSARRATTKTGKWELVLDDFYPRPPRGGRRYASGRSKRPAMISIHALREEGDRRHRAPCSGILPISIHALREEGDSGKRLHRGR